MNLTTLETYGDSREIKAQLDNILTFVKINIVGLIGIALGLVLK